MSVSVVQLVSEISLKGADVAEAGLASMGEATDVADAALEGLEVRTMSLSEYLDSLDVTTGTTSAAMDGLSISSDAASASLASTNATLAESSTAADASAASMSNLSASQDKAAASADGLKGIGLGLGVVAVAAAALGVVTVKMSGDVQSGMTALVTGAGEAQSNIQMLTAGVLKASIDTGTSTKSLEDGLYLIESAGQHGSQALDTLRMAAMGAKVGSASLADVANGVTTEMTDYASSGLTAAQATNTLIAAVSAGKTHMADLANAMSTVLPTAAAMKVSLTDVSGAMATMTGEGTDAASAATYLRQLLSALENPATKGAKALAEIGLSTQQVSDEMKKSLPATLALITDHLKTKFPEGSAAYVKALADISGGSKQMQGMLELTGEHLQVFQGNVASITDAVNKGGNSITGWDLVQQDFNFQLDKAKQIVVGFADSIGTQLLPYATDALKFFSDVAQIGPQFQGVSDALSKDVLPVFQVVSSFVGGQFLKDMQTVGIETQQIGFWFEFTLKPALDEALPAFEHLGEAVLTKVLPAFLAIWGAGQNLTREVFPLLVDIVEHAAPPILRLASIISDGLGSAISFLAPYVVEAAQAIDGFAGDIATRVAPIVEGWFDGLNAHLKQFQEVWNDIWPYLEPVVKFLFDDIVKQTEAAFTLITGIVKFGLDVMGGNWKQAKQDVQDAMNQMNDQANQKSDQMSSHVSNSAQSMSSQVQASLASMMGGGLSSMTSLSDGGSRVFDQFKANGLADMASLDAGTISYFNDIASYLDRANAKYAQTQANAAAKVAVQSGKISSGIANKNFAAGTDYAPGGDGWVGEQGPEYAFIPQGTQIIPHNDLRGMGGAYQQQQIIVQPPPIYLDGRQLMNGLMPHFVDQVRYGAGINGL